MAATEPGRAHLRGSLGPAACLLMGSLWLCADHGAAQQSLVQASLHHYQDDDQLTVVHPAASASLGLGDDWQATAAWDADVISAATVDVRTSASPRGFQETRHGVTIEAGYAPRADRSAKLGYALSTSPDHVSHTLGLSGRMEFDSRQRTLSASLTVSGAEIGRVGQEHPDGHLYAGGASLTWSSLLSRRAVLELGGAGEFSNGYQKSPYRFVPIEPAPDSAGDTTVHVSENVPDDRLRAVLHGRLRWIPLGWLVVRPMARFFWDQWAIVGGLLQVDLLFEPAADLLLGLGVRAYGQGAASFYQGRYQTLPYVPRYRTLDRELAAGHYQAMTASVQWLFARPGRSELRMDANAELRQQHYLDTPRLPRRVSLILGAALSAGW